MPTISDPYHGQLQELFSLRRTSRRRTLDDMRRLLESLQHPETQYPVVQIVGTNGKGSTAAFLAAMLQAAGYRTGLFTSPHLIEFRERFQVAGQIVDDASLAPLLQHVLHTARTIGVPPVFFDVATAMAALLFAQEHVDIAIFEAGMGARLDATTALPAILTIITQVGFDHDAWLGATVADIARDKAAGLRPGQPGIIGVRTEPALSTILQQAAQLQPSLLWQIGKDFPDLTQPQQHLTSTSGGHDVSWWYDLSPGLPGSYQWHNLSLALAATQLLQAEGFHCSPESVKEAMQHVSWPGRMQRICWEQRDIWLDGAHNASGMEALMTNFSEQPLCLLFGAMQDKDIPALLRPALPHLQTLILCPIQLPRAASPEQLQQIAQQLCPNVDVYCASSLTDALHRATTHTPSSQSIVLTGSLFLVGEVLALQRTLDMP